MNFISLFNLSFFSHQFMLIICLFITIFVFFITIYIYFNLNCFNLNYFFNFIIFYLFLLLLFLFILLISSYFSQYHSSGNSFELLGFSAWATISEEILENKGPVIWRPCYFDCLFTADLNIPAKVIVPQVVYPVGNHAGSLGYYLFFEAASSIKKF